jgi:hypothetical protein
MKCNLKVERADSLVEIKFPHYACEEKMLVSVDCSEASVMAEMCPLQNPGAVTLIISISGPLRGHEHTFLANGKK